MDVTAEVGFFHHPHQLFRWNTPFSNPYILPPKRHICHHVPLHGVYGFTCCMKNHKSVRRLAALSTDKGKPTTSVDELCNIIWTVEADLEDGHLLYVTGDPAVLGCWKPDMAVLMSPVEHTNVWKAEFQIAFGLNFKYNYFIKGKSRSSSDIIWKPGPAFSLSVPLTVLEDDKIVVRDLWIMSDSHMSSAHAWSPCTEETYLLNEPSIYFPIKDEGRNPSLLENDVPKFKTLILEDQFFYEDMVIMNDKDSHSPNTFSENYQPVEEPWLLRSPPIVSEDKTESDESETDDTVKEQVKLVGTEKLLPEESSNMISKDPVSTIILINSSICTMQRIAVLEDEKLVELLLEPVKTNVQCDSVYVGVITKFVPHMGGAFVNIGNSRPALMDIKEYKEPFIFPPFCRRTKKQEIDLKGKKDHMSRAADISDGISDMHSEDGYIKSGHNDYDEHEGDDDFYISEVLKENVNGGVVDDEVEADFEDDVEGSDVHIEGEMNNSSLPFGTNGSVNSHILQTKDTKRATYMASGEDKWIKVRKGTKIVVQVVKEGLGTKGPTLTAYPKLRSRFWVLTARCDKIGVSKKISGVERTRLKVIAKTLQPEGFGLTVRTVAAGHSFEELQKDLDGLLSTWKNIMEHAKSAALAADEGVEGAVPVIFGTIVPPSSSIGEFSIGQEQLSSISREHDTTALREYGGVVGLSHMLKTNLEKGIQGDDTDLVKRRTAFGSNNYPRKKGRSVLMFIWDACKDLTLIILMVAAIASLALGIKSEGIKEGWYDGGSIAFAVILVIVVTAISDYKQSLQFRDLNEHKRDIHLQVIRDGRRVEISIYDVVVGDVIPLNIGNQVPADGILITGHSLAIDESSMTGESKIVDKHSKEPFLMSGCKVADGCGTMLVTAVGINTEWGLLMASISEDNGEETPLQVRLNGVATFIGIVGLSVAVIVLTVLLARYFSGHTKNADGSVQFIAGKTRVGDAIDGVIKIFTIAVTIVVVAVPEGLPLAVTLTLAYSMKKMMADKALVRRLSACETMGSATTICSDKTGTLTMNQMTVVEACIGGKKIVPLHDKSQLSPMLCSLLIEGVAQNTNGSIYVPEGGNGVEVSGSPTEKAILHWGFQLGMDFEAARSESAIIHVFPFNSDKKRGGVALQTPDAEIHIHWKGAAEIVLACCTWYFDTNDQLVEMDEEKMTVFKKVIEDMAADSLRCIAIAYRLYEMENVPTSEEELAHWSLPEDDLVLLAIVGLKDPCRPGVKDAVQLCQKAGVKVKMVTGDNVKTAKAIAVECGILGSFADATEPNIIEGKTFRALSDEEREEIVERISVMGRSSPNDKLLLVQALRRKGHVVAVTGDGTNDAPALHEADIGLAMGIQGTEVAKESSDIIILDDNFASVVKVVKWGRSVYANIQKFIQFQLTVNIAALVINVVAAFSSGDIPLNTVQLLWVNLIMDTLGALALATEPPTDHLMDQLPVGRREPLVTNVMWRNLLIQAMYQVSVLLILNFRGRSILGLRHETYDFAVKVKNTLIFNAFVLCQVFNEFNARKPDEFNIFKGVTRNYLFMGIVGLTIVLQIVIIEFLGKFTKTVKLNWQQWLISVIIGFISWPLAVVGKLIPVPTTPMNNIFQRFRRRRT